MNNEADTRVIGRDKTEIQSSKKRRLSNAPLYVLAITGVITVVTLGVIMMRVIEKKHLAKKSGLVTATYNARPLAELLHPEAPVKEPPKFNHVIFRLGDVEIFRFKYEDGGAGLNYSFEVVEGGS